MAVGMKKVELKLSGTLSAYLSDTATSIDVNNPPSEYPTYLTIEPDTTNEEIIKVTNVSGNTLTIVRGQGGTSAKEHQSGSAYEQRIVHLFQNETVDTFDANHDKDTGNHKTLKDTNGNEWIEQGATGSAVNQVKVSNAATGNAPAIEASGDDSNIDLEIKAKGTGKVKLGSAGLEFPNSDGSADQVLKTDGSGTLSFADSSSDGWTSAGETWTYASADDPTFTFTISGDKTSKYSAGMKIKLTQGGSTKYFIITKVSYSSPNTTVTIYGGTDYDLANATISNPYYSTQRAPLDFPLNPTKWTVEVKNTAALSQSSPTAGTYYNLGSLSIDIPIGLWKVNYQVVAQLNDGTTVTHVDGYVALSTSNNSASDNDLLCFFASYGASSTIRNYSQLYREKVLNLSTKDTYYLIMRNVGSTINLIAFRGNLSPTIIRATCAYL